MLGLSPLCHRSFAVRLHSVLGLCLAHLFLGCLLTAAETPAPEPQPPVADDPPPAEAMPPMPDAVPPGEMPPWGPPAVPPDEAESPYLPGSGPRPASAPDAESQPAAATGPRAGDRAGDLDPDLDNQQLDLRFLDVLVPKHPRTKWRVSTAFDIAATADIDETRASVGTQSIDFTAGYKGFSLHYKRNLYDWDLHGEGVFPSFPTAAGGGRRDPWQDLHQVGLSWFQFRFWKPRWSYFYGVGVNAGFEKEMKDCFTAFAMGSLAWRYNDHWTFNFGLMVAANRIHVLPLPMVGFKYRRDSENGWFVEIGFPSLLVGYRINEQWMVSTKFIEGDDGGWRLSDHNPVAHGGYLEVKGAKTGFDCQWKPGPGWTVNTGVKYLFSRQWTVRSSTLKHKETINLNNAMYMQASVEYAF